LRLVRSGADIEPEAYLDIAILDWLVQYRVNPNAAQALSELGQIVESRHHDMWLNDMLASKASGDFDRGAAHLAAALKANLAGRAEPARVESRQAAHRFRRAGSHAGSVRAAVEEVYALHRSLTRKTCFQSAVTLESEVARSRYAWVLSQTRLEEGICRAMLGAPGGGIRDIHRALTGIREAGYRFLELRAVGLLVTLQTNMGNQLVAWKTGRDGLAKYWSGPAPYNRAHQFYFDLSRAAEYLGHRQTAYVFGRAAVSAIAATPNRPVEALGRAKVAALALAAGMREEAQSELAEADRSFAGLEQDDTVRKHRLEAEINLAEVQADGADPADALDRLNRLGREYDTMPEIIQLRFHQGLGQAYLRQHDFERAEQALRQAVDDSETRLASLGTSEDRMAALRESGKAYRGLVEIRLVRDTDAKESLRTWEWYRAAEFPGAREEVGLTDRLRRLSDETVISYAALPGGLTAWVFDDGGFEVRRLPVRAEELETVANRFLRQCADPASNWVAMRRDARQLYRWLIGPVAHRLLAGRTLVVEPDGVIAGIPMQALVDQDSRFLGERFPIVYSRGLVEYQRNRARLDINQKTFVLIVARPALGADMSQAFAPLLDAEREGAAAAAHFERRRLLTGRNATMAAVERSRPDAELFHFAGHGFSNGGNGGLLLAADQGNPYGAEVLDSAKLAGQDWSRCRLVVLSACSTGTGESKGPVNPESLVWAFLQAGAARVVASQWNVDASATAALMDRMYQALLSGSDASGALRKAAADFRKAPATAHPYYWAGFQTYGRR
jgi:CHAT domain-containing protein